MKSGKNKTVNTNILISIIVPVYNVEKYLKKSVDSILKQTYKNLEIILVDDGSTDQSGEICSDYEKKDERIITIHKKNEGLVSSRYVGVDRATGVYTTFVDSDDWIEPEWIQTMVEFVQKTQAEIITAGFMQFDENGNEMIVQDRIPCGLYKTRKKLAEKVYPQMICYDKECRAGITVATWDKLFLTALLKKHAGNISYNIKWGTDYVLTFPCILDAQSIYISDSVHLYHYRVNALSLTVHADQKFVFHMESLFQGMDNLLNKSDMSYISKQILQSKVQIMAQRGVNNAYKIGKTKISRWIALYQYNSALTKSNYIRGILAEVLNYDDILPEKSKKIANAIFNHNIVKAMLIEMFQ